MNEPNNQALRADGPGALLRAARDRQGLHIAALAAAIKVSPRKLDALENERWHELPDATFTRALAQTVCRTLKVDPRPILEQIPAAAPVALGPDDAGLNEPFRDRPGRDAPGLMAGAVRPLVWGAAVLMLAAVVVYVVPSDVWSWRPGDAKVAPQVPPAAAPLVVAPAAPPVATAAAASAAADALASPPQASSETAQAAQPAPAGAEVAAPPPPAAAVPAAGLVQLQATQASWVEALDANGETLLSRTVQADERVGFDGKLPIRLTIGNAAATKLSFRGKEVDLVPDTRSNVARVELK